MVTSVYLIHGILEFLEYATLYKEELGMLCLVLCNSILKWLFPL